MQKPLPFVILISIIIVIILFLPKIQSKNLDKQVDQLIKESNQLEQNLDLTDQNQLLVDFKNTAPSEIPEWVSVLGFEEPTNLTYLEEKSKQTFFDLINQSYDSVELVYSGQFEEIKIGIDEIIKNLKIKLIPIKGQNKISDPKIMGYTNFDEKKPNQEYLITIYANGKTDILTINFTNAKQMKQVIQPTLETNQVINENIDENSQDLLEQRDLQQNNN